MSGVNTLITVQNGEIVKIVRRMNQAFKNPYKTSGKWYKGNTHIHSTRSDGGLNLNEILDLYTSRGYSFLAITDHGKTIDEVVPERKDILLIKGIEIEGCIEIDDTNETKRKIFPHIIGLYSHVDEPIGEDYNSSIEVMRKNNTYLIACHPFWSNDTVERLSGFNSLDAIEIYNHVCIDMNYRGYSLHFWDLFLTGGRKIWGIAADDAHFTSEYPYFDGGWVVVKCREFTEAEIINSLREGNFYSSQGPEIYEIGIIESLLRIKCTPLKKVEIYSDGEKVKVLSSARGKLTSVWEIPIHDIVKGSANYFRVELKDEKGKVAWTNPFFRY